MIYHGSKTNKLFSTGKNPKIEVIRGYYLVLPNSDRYWLGEDKYTAAMALTKVCDQHLSDAIGWDYWIDFCYGLDVHRRLAWENIDRTDLLIDISEQY